MLYLSYLLLVCVYIIIHYVIVNYISIVYFINTRQYLICNHESHHHQATSGLDVSPSATPNLIPHYL